MSTSSEAQIEQKHVTVVLSPGRSGSSILTEILGKLGLNISTELIAGRSDNARGFFEDSRIVAIHKTLLSELGGASQIAFPSNWLQSAAAKEALEELAAVVREEVKPGSNWIFKDPRTTLLLPLWGRVFKNTNVIPKYIFAFRDPRSVADSLLRTEGTSQVMSERVWLLRSIEALHQTSAAGYFVHYEDWFTHPRETARGLVRWVGLEEPGEERLGEVLDEVIKRDLIHSAWSTEETKSPLVRRLYNVLQDCSGSNFNRNRVMAEVSEIRSIIESFGNSSSAEQKSKQGDKNEVSEEQNKQRVEMISEMHRQIRDLKKMEEENYELRVRLQSHVSNGEPRPKQTPSGPKPKKNESAKAPRNNSLGRTSGQSAKDAFSKQVGDTLLSAFASPRWGLPRLPKKLWRLYKKGKSLRSQGAFVGSE